MLWQPIRKIINEDILRELDMPPIPMSGPFKQLYEEQTPGLYAFSELVVPRPKDWPDWIHVTGYWFLEPPVRWEPSRELKDFLDAGPPPVYIGFGSMPNRKPTESAEIALEALEKSGQRGILLQGWGGLKPRDLPKTVFLLDSIPHTWLFPRMAAVVHHGGAGTTGASLRSGVPSIVIPHFADQPFWGERVYKLGVGPKPIPRWRLTANGLAKSICKAVEDEGMQKKASDFGRAIRIENGVQKAVDIILSQLNQN
jgi:sterol 3beta-glucosyltransferase